MLQLFRFLCCKTSQALQRAWQLSVGLACVLFLMQACGEKISKTPSFTTNETFLLEIAQGNGMVGLPQRPFEEPVVFVLRDSNRKPVPFASVKLNLVNVTGAQAADWPAVASAIRDERPSLASAPTSLAAKSDAQPSSPIAEKAVGRLLGASSKTDADGRLVVRYVGPERFSQKIAIVAWLGDTPADNTAHAIATLQTRSQAESTQVRLVSTNLGLETAGSPFDINLRIEDAAGEVDRTFDGELKFKLTHDAKASWSGLLPTLPGEFSCLFMGGTCSVKGGPFVLTQVGNVQLTLSESLGLFSPARAAFQVKSSGVPANIAFVPASATVAQARPLETLSLTADSTTSLRAILVDVAGNILGDAKDAVWSSQDEFLSSVLSDTRQATLSLAPKQIGLGSLYAASSKGSAKGALKVEVLSGPFAGVRLAFDQGNVLTAGPCVPFDLEAVDAKGNRVVSYEGKTDTLLALTGHDKGTPVLGTTSFRRAGRLHGNTLSLSATFARGLSAAAAEICPFKALEDATITSTAKGSSIPTPFSVIPGAPRIVVLSRTPAAEGIASACLDMQDTANLLLPCVTLSADNDLERLFPIVTDTAGNPAPWLEPLSVSASGPLGTSGNLAWTLDRSGLDANPASVGKGFVTVSASETLATRYAYEISPGVRTRLDIKVSGPTATQRRPSVTAPLDLELQWYDRKGNPNTNYQGTESFVVELLDAAASPSGATPTINVPTNATFAAGIANVVGTVRAVRAVDRPRVRVTTAKGAFLSDVVVLDPGPLASLSLRTLPGGNGTAYTEARETQIFSVLSLFTAGYDALGNYVSDPMVAFTGSNPFMTSSLTSAAETLSTFSPSVTGVGTVRATTTDPNLVPALTFETGAITVTSKTASRYVVNTNHNLEEVAGTPFDIIIDATDSEGNVDTLYSGSKLLSFASLANRSFRGNIPLMPQGNLPCTFTAGRCTLPPPFGTNWTLFDAETLAAITVSDASNVIPRAWSALIQVSKGTPAELFLADKAGGPSTGAIALDITTTKLMTVDQTLSMTAAALDSAGNWVKDVAASWSGNTAGITSYLSAPTSVSVVLAPRIPVQESEAGKLQVSYSEPGISLAAEWNMVIDHGVPTRIAVSTQGNITALPVGECTKIDVAIVDQYSNIAYFYSLQNPLRIGVKNLRDAAADHTYHPFRPGLYFDRPTGTSIPYQHIAPFLNSDGVYSTGLFYDPVLSYRQGGNMANAVFIQGRLSNALTLCVTDSGPNVAPEIVAEVAGATLPGTNMSFPTLTGGVGPLSVPYGAPHSVTLSVVGTAFNCSRLGIASPYNPWVVDEFNIVPAYTTPGSKGSFLCNNTNPSNTIGNSVADALRLKTTVYDKGGTKLRDGSGTFITVAKPATESVTALPDNAQLDFQARVGDWNRGETYGRRIDYAFQFLDTQASPAVYSDVISIALGTEDAVQMAVAAVGNVVATNPFALNVSFFDRYGNTTGKNAPTTLSVAGGASALASPSGLAATVPSSLAVSLLLDGGTRMQTAQSFQLPRAGSSVSLGFTAVGKPAIPNGSLLVVPQPGPAARLYLALAELHAVEVSSPLSQLTTVDQSYAVGVKDVLENPTINYAVDTTVSGIVAEMLGATPARAFAYAFNPEGSGTGTFTLRDPAGVLPNVPYTVNIADAPVDALSVTLEDAGVPVVGPLEVGKAYDVRVQALDADGDVLREFSGSKTVPVGLIRSSSNAENNSDVLTTPAANAVVFTQGVSNAGQITFTPKTTQAGQALDASYNAGAVSASGRYNVTVTPGAFDHYGVELGPDPRTDYAYTARQPQTETFAATIRWRDAFGNSTSSGPAGTVTLALRREDGTTAAAGSLSGTTSGITISAAGTTVSDLSYNAPGRYRVIALNGANGTPALASTRIDAAASLQAVVSYGFEPPGGGAATVSAGVSFFVQVSARDAYGQTISGIDAELSGQAYTLSGAPATTTGNTSTMPSTLSFSGGVAFAPTTLFKTGTLTPGTLLFRDGLLRQGSHAANITVLGGTVNRYEITTTSPLTRTADGDATTGRFNLTVRALDAEGNVTPGEPGLGFRVTRVDGNLLLNTGNVVYAGSISPVSLTTVATTGQATVTGLGYYSSGAINIAFNGTTFPVVGGGLQMTFAYTPASVDQYFLRINNTVSSSQVNAGPNNVPVRVTAVDRNANTVDTVDATLNALPFEWRGLATSPGGEQPVLPLPNFISGVANVTLSLYAAQALAPAMLQLDDNATPDNRTGDNEYTLTVRALSPSVLAGNVPGSATAGSPFGFTLTPRDAYGNVSTTGCSTLALTGGTTSSGAHGRAATPASLPSAVSVSGSNDFPVANALLYSSGTESLVATACGGIQRSFGVAVSPAGNDLLQFQDAADASGTAIGTATLTAGTIRDWYLASYDAYGNARGLIPANFSASTGALTLTPVATGVVRVAAVNSGTAVLTANPTNGLSSISTGTLTVSAAAVASFQIVPLGGAAGGNVTAGDSISLEIRAVDASGNVATGFSGAKVLSFSTTTPAANPEGRSLVLPAPGAYTFTAGVISAPLTAMAHNASSGAQITVAHSDGTNVFFGSRSLTVAAGPFHHYGVTSDSTYLPTWDRANTFSATASLRDASGNTLTSGGPGLPVTLRIVRSDGVAATGALSGTTALAALGAPASVANLRYDEAGTFKVLADDDGNAATLETPLNASTTITMTPSLALVQSYSLLASSTTVTAGSVLPFTLTALDGYNRPTPGIDAQLNALKFTMSGPANAPNSAAPALPSNTSLSFNGGVATILTELKKAETLAIGSVVVSDDRAIPVSAANTAAITVNPANTSRYTLTSTHATRNADSTGTGAFSLTAAALDAFDNVAPGENGLTISAERVSGPTNATVLRTSGGATLSSFSMASGSATFSNVSYLVGQTVDFAVAGTALPTNPKARVTFSPTLGTLKSYALTPAANPVTAGLLNASFTVMALDYGDNALTGIDAALDALTFTWSGPSSNSPSPSSQLLSYGFNTGNAGRLAFTNGVATGNVHSLYRAETIAASNFRVTDSNTKQGAYTLPFVVAPAVASSLTLSGYAATQTAGTAFNVVASARDAFSNATNVGCSANDLVTSYTGLDAPLGGTPTIATGVGQSVLGQYTVANTLVKSGSNAVTYTACGGLQATATVTVNESTTTYMTVKASDNSVPATPANAVPASVQCANTSNASAAISCPTLYAFMWDTYGNRVDPVGSTCAWSYTTIGGAPTPSVSGGAFAYTLTHSNYIDGTLRCTRDSHFRDVPVYGGTSRMELSHTYTAPVNAGSANVTLSSVTLFQRNAGAEIAKSDAGVATVSLSKTNYNAIAFGTGAGTVGQPSSLGCSFNSSGVCSGPYAFNLTASAPAGTPATITVSLFGLSQGIGPMTINPTTATTLDVSGMPTTATAGSSYSGTIVAKDSNGNPTNVGCTTLSITGSSLASTGRTESPSQSPSLPSGVALSGTTGTYNTGSFTLFKAATNALTVNACGLTAPVNVAVSPNTQTNLIVTATNNSAAANIADGDVYCPHTAATGTNVSCAFYAWPWDAFGNLIPSGTCTLGYTANATSTGLGAVAPSGVSGTVASTTVTATDFIDGTFTCANGGITRTFNLYGGTSALAITAANVSGTNVSNTANVGNVTANYTAGNSVNVTQVTAYARKGGVAVARPAYAGAETFALSTDSSQGMGTTTTGPASNQYQLGVAAAPTCTLNASGQCTTSFQFRFRAVDGVARSITFGLRSKTASLQGINVVPATSTALAFSNPGTQTAGVGFNVTVTPQDAFGNASVSGCASPQTLNVTAPNANTTSSGATNGGTATPATVPGTDVAISGTTFTVPLTLFNGGTAGTATSNTINYQLKCNGTNSTAATNSVNVNANASVNLIRVSSSVSIPTAHDTTFDCGGASATTSISCSLNAYAWDAYGNNISGTSWSCPAWSYADATGNTPTTGAAGRTYTVSNANYHVNGTVTCTNASPSRTASTTVFRKIQRTFTHSCGAWSCSADPSPVPVSTCTVTNTTNYAASAVSLTAPGAGSNTYSPGCGSGLSAGANCTYQIQGVPGSASGTWQASMTESAPAQVTFNTGITASASGNAPNCTNALTPSIGTWTCVAGQGQIQATFTNNNGITAATMGAGPSFSTANGATFATLPTNCTTSIPAGGGQCVVTVNQATPAQTSQLDVAAGAFFGAASIGIPSSPNCTVALSFDSATVKTACSASGGSKTLTVTLRNNNTLNNAFQSALTASGGTGATISNNTCTTLNKNATCTFDISWATTPTATSDGGATYTASSYFSALSLTSAQLDNSCPP